LLHCILNPQGLINTDGDPSQGIGGYHGNANVPYCFVNLFGTNLTIDDANNDYAMALSHEIAEMTVDPLANLVNPEVCDPCGPNCQTVFIDYFDTGGNTSDLAGVSARICLQLLVNGIVKPAAATQCPAPSTHATTHRQRGCLAAGIGCGKGANADGRLEVFGLGVKRRPFVAQRAGLCRTADGPAGHL